MKENEGSSRRDALKGAGAVALGVAAVGVLSPGTASAAKASFSTPARSSSSAFILSFHSLSIDLWRLVWQLTQASCEATLTLSPFL